MSRSRAVASHSRSSPASPAARRPSADGIVRRHHAGCGTSDGHQADGHAQPPAHRRSHAPAPRSSDAARRTRPPRCQNSPSSAPHACATARARRPTTSRCPSLSFGSLRPQTFGRARCPAAPTARRPGSRRRSLPGGPGRPLPGRRSGSAAAVGHPHVDESQCLIYIQLSEAQPSSSPDARPTEPPQAIHRRL
jgi:hypothetical protein